MFETKSKTVPITQEMVKAAYRKVKANQGSAGVDEESLAAFQADLSNNLYQLWNRLSSGSYYPKPVREVSIPKANGSRRLLGIPTVSDRIAQQVIKHYLEPRLEEVFHENSYGYCPLKSAHQAVEAVRTNVRQYAWVLDLDIKSFFDEVDHELLMKGLDCHVEEKWVKMYIRRWLEVPSQSEDGTLTQKAGRGTPQGGVISPLLSNLYLHYVLDKWLEKYHSKIAFVRYADDIVLHCTSEEEAIQLRESIGSRLQACRLRLNEEKTKLVYCQNYRREKKNYKKRFNFLGFSFKPESLNSKDGGMFLGYTCSISQESQTRIVRGWKQEGFHRQSTLTIQEIAAKINPQMIGIIRYYGKFNKWALQTLMRQFHYRLVTWLLNKYKGLKGSHDKAYQWIRRIRSSYPNLFYHWSLYKTI